MKRSLDLIVEYFFYLFLFLLPWQTRLILKEGVLNGGYWEWGTISLYAIDIVFIILLLLFCLEKLISKNFQFSISNFQTNSKFKTQNPKFYILVIIFLLFTISSTFWAKDRNLSFYWWLRICQSVILFFLLQKINFDLIKAGFTLVLAGLVQFFLGLSQFIQQKVFSSKWLGMAAQDPAQAGVSVIEVGGGRLLRIYGSLPHPNILAGFLVFVIFIAFLAYFLTQKTWQKYFFLLATSLIAIGLLLTYSRAGLVSLILTIIIFSLVLLKKNLAHLRTPFFEFFGLVLIAALIFGGFFVHDLITRAQLKGRLEKISLSERISSFQQSQKVIQENFLFGVGLGNYTLHLAQKYPNLSVWDYQPIPNIYLLVLAELGILGLILFLFILFYSLSKFSILHSIFFPLLVVGLFDHWLFSLSFGIILFWLSLGLLWKTSLKIS
ncbi:MAG: O-antigen ligase family protein [Patescibacteria group bacterium]|nr:O-antigen ligase family protein [Patescibacteria group bacterium]